LLSPPHTHFFLFYPSQFLNKLRSSTKDYKNLLSQVSEAEVRRDKAKAKFFDRIDGVVGGGDGVVGGVYTKPAAAGKCYLDFIAEKRKRGEIARMIMNILPNCFVLILARWVFHRKKIAL